MRDEPVVCCECEALTQTPVEEVGEGKFVCSRSCSDLHKIGMPHAAAIIRKITAA